MHQVFLYNFCSFWYLNSTNTVWNLHFHILWIWVFFFSVTSSRTFRIQLHFDFCIILRWKKWQSWLHFWTFKESAFLKFACMLQMKCTKSKQTGRYTPGSSHETLRHLTTFSVAKLTKIGVWPQNQNFVSQIIWTLSLADLIFIFCGHKSEKLWVASQSIRAILLANLNCTF